MAGKGEKPVWSFGTILAWHFIGVASDPGPGDLARAREVFWTVENIRTNRDRRAAIMRFLHSMVEKNKQQGYVYWPLEGKGTSPESELVRYAELLRRSDADEWCVDTEHYLKARELFTAFLGKGAKWDLLNEFLAFYGLAVKTTERAARKAWSKNSRSNWEHPLAREWRSAKRTPDRKDPG